MRRSGGGRGGGRGGGEGRGGGGEKERERTAPLVVVSEDVESTGRRRSQRSLWGGERERRRPRERIWDGSGVVDGGA